MRLLRHSACACSHLRQPVCQDFGGDRLERDRAAIARRLNLHVGAQEFGARLLQGAQRFGLCHARLLLQAAGLGLQLLKLLPLGVQSGLLGRGFAQGLQSGGQSHPPDRGQGKQDRTPSQQALFPLAQSLPAWAQGLQHGGQKRVCFQAHGALPDPAALVSSQSAPSRRA